MIDLYTWTTPNGRKISILLEELGLDYSVHAIDITAGDQKRTAYRAINPNGKIPAIVDRGVMLAETGAIMLYLAEKHGRFLPLDAAGRWHVIQWLVWQVSGLGPMLGEAHHFLHFHPGKSGFAEARYATEARRLHRVLDRQLVGRDFIAGDYSIADMACWPWISRFDWQAIDLNDYPNIRQWYVRIAERPAVQKGYNIPHFVNDIPMPAD